MSNALVSLPLCALTRSKLNIRKTDRKADLEQLAASIESQGLLENLVVRENGGEIYEVIAGARRLAALKLLARKKKVPNDHPVSCLVLESGSTSDIIEVSLAENLVRAPVHPADQYEAFAKLQKEGLPEEDIAARFGLSKKMVQQRLKLAAVSPKLMADYRKDLLYLEQLMAFTITDDHDLQERIWNELADNNPSPHTIRHHLTRTHVNGSDRRALFVGTKAYEAAGGIIVRDLFDEADEGYFTDIALLDRLVLEKLEREAETIRKEGWAWVEARSDNGYIDLSRYGRIRMVEARLADEEEARLASLSERYDQLVTQMEDEENAELSKELDRVSAELESLQDKRETWPEDEKKRAGAVVSLDYTGCPQIVRGLVRPEDRDAISATAGEAAREASSAIEVGKGYAESLHVDLAVQRTAALQESLAGRPDVALVALLHVLVLHAFFDDCVDDCISIVPRRPALTSLSPAIGESKAMVALSKRKAKWHARLPSHEALWPWIEALSRRDKLDLLAYCVGVTLDATHRRGSGENHSGSSERVARAVGLDMAEWWKPTKEAFFDRLTKVQIADVVSEACSADAARTLDGLKKSEMSGKAEAMVSGTRWLPSALRDACDRLADIGPEATTE